MNKRWLAINTWRLDQLLKWRRRDTFAALDRQRTRGLFGSVLVLTISIRGWGMEVVLGDTWGMDGFPQRER